MTGLLKRLIVLGSAALLLALADVPSGLAGAETYKLGARDKLLITVYGERDLSGEFEVDSGGAISMPLIGDVRAAGSTVRELEKRVTDKLRDGYLRKPMVSAAVVARRPFFIDGAVDRPGEYPASEGMTVREAVAVAGGFKFWANTENALVARRSDSPGRTRTVAIDDFVGPGDYIWIQD